MKGAPVLLELRGAEAVLAWQTCGDVVLWATTPAARRGGLFNPRAAQRRVKMLAAAALHPDVAPLYDSLVAVLREPDSSDAGIISQICLRISGWAASTGRYHTGVAFAQAAALSAPDDAAASYEVGRLAMEMAHTARAESWLHRAVGQARRSGAGESYVGAWIGLGLLGERAGDWQLARARYATAARAAREGRAGEDLLVVATHGLLRVLTAAGEFERAWRYGQLALRRSRRTPGDGAGIRLDLALLRLRQGDYDGAGEQLQRVRAASLTPEQQLYFQVLRAQTAAGLRDVHAVAAAWHEAWPGLQAAPRSEYRTRALIELVRAMALIGDVRRASAAAELARITTASLVGIGPPAVSDQPVTGERGSGVEEVS